MMDFMDYTMDKYGAIGGIILALAIVVVTLAWIVLSVLFILPVIIPVIFAGYAFYNYQKAKK